MDRRTALGTDILALNCQVEDLKWEHRGLQRKANAHQKEADRHKRLQSYHLTRKEKFVDSMCDVASRLNAVRSEIENFRSAMKKIAREDRANAKAKAKARKAAHTISVKKK